MTVRPISDQEREQLVAKAWERHVADVRQAATPQYGWGDTVAEGVAGLLAFAIYVGGFLFVLYLLIQFIKWAW